MLNYTLKPEGLLLMQPQGPLTQQDFARMNLEVNAYLTEHAKLHVVMIEAKDFPGWENWAGFSAHLSFVRDHHKQVERIALVTDSQLVGMAEFLGKHFTGAQIRHFPFGEETRALQWLQSD